MPTIVVESSAVLSHAIKEAAWQVMEAAYLAASADGTLPALAGQIFYSSELREIIWPCWTNPANKTDHVLI